MTRYGYLGPEGTFTSMALDAWGPAAGAERVAFGSVDAALAALRAGDVAGAMVPIENSVEGGVSATLDALASGDPLVVTGEGDVGSNPRMARLLHARIAGSRLEILPGLRHAILIEAPTTVARLLAAFYLDAANQA